MRTNIVDIEHRLKWKADKTKGILQYDEDNSYPERISSIIDASGTASKCTEVFRRFVTGDNFVDASVRDTVVNEDGDLMSFLLEEVAKDWTRFNGFAIHVTYNGLFQKTDFEAQSFAAYRLPDPEDDDHRGMIAYYDDWSKIKRKRIDKRSIVWLPLFDPEAVEDQVAEAGGIENYTGQVLYYSKEGSAYPKAPIDPELESAIVDAEIKDFNLNNITTNFMLSHLFLYKGTFSTDKERQAYMNDLKEFQGAKKASRLMLIEGITSSEDAPEIKPFQVADYDKLFEQTEKSVQGRIRRLYSIAPILASDQLPGSLGVTKEFNEALKMYNRMTKNDRAKISACFVKLFDGLVQSNFLIQELSPLDVD